jgi:hypothetical protein
MRPTALALMLGWLMGHGIEPHIPILDHEHQTNGYFTRADFTFDATANAFVCPAGKQPQAHINSFHHDLGMQICRHG